jgi:hypothetical protein
MIPTVGGMIVGNYFHRLFTIASLGLALWISQILLLLGVAHIQGHRGKLPYLNTFATIFSFAAAYSFGYVAIVYIFPAH